MISESKLEANQENARLSTGPHDATRTRLNSLKHGILSKVALITFGEGPEDLEAFQELSSSLRQDLAPAGALEEFLVDLVITEAWRWRRVIRYESTLIRKEVDSEIERWQKLENQAGIEPPRRMKVWDSTANLVWEAEFLAELLSALETDDPLETYPDLWMNVFAVAKERFKVPIRNLLHLDRHWNMFPEFPREEIDLVISEASRRGNVSSQEFWDAVRKDVRQQHEHVDRNWQNRRRELEREGLLPRMPNDRDLAKVQRYEANTSRQFYRALHELQRVQAARNGFNPPPPLAVDVDVDVGHLGE